MISISGSPVEHLNVSEYIWISASLVLLEFSTWTYLFRFCDFWSFSFKCPSLARIMQYVTGSSEKGSHKIAVLSNQNQHIMHLMKLGTRRGNMDGNFPIQIRDNFNLSTQSSSIVLYGWFRRISRAIDRLVRSSKFPGYR